MPTFKPVLWTSEPHKDGRCAVKIYGKRKFYHVQKVAILPEDWDETNGKVKRTNPLHAAINSVIKARLLEIETAYLEGREIPKKKKENKPEAKAKTTISDFIGLYVAEAVKGQHDLAAGTIKHYKALQMRLNQFAEHRGKPVYFDDVDSDFYGDFWQFLNTNFGIQKAGGFAKHIKILKKFMNEAQRRGLHKNDAHRDKSFKVHRSQGQKIYLTEDEVDKLEKLDLSSMPHLEVERDRWLICYYFLLRYQDGQDFILRDNFFQSKGKTYFRYEAGKTGTSATIPVKPRALEILEKYNYQMPKTTNQEANWKIKMIASMAGINTPAQENGAKGPKCNFVRTHTARRSAATNLAMQGVPLDFIAKLGGWKKLEVLKVYLLASGLDVAAAVSEYDFFK